MAFWPKITTNTVIWQNHVILRKSQFPWFPCFRDFLLSLSITAVWPVPDYTAWLIYKEAIKCHIHTVVLVSDKILLSYLILSWNSAAWNRSVTSSSSVLMSRSLSSAYTLHTQTSIWCIPFLVPHFVLPIQNTFCLYIKICFINTIQLLISFTAAVFKVSGSVSCQSVYIFHFALMWYTYHWYCLI